MFTARPRPCVHTSLTWLLALSAACAGSPAPTDPLHPPTLAPPADISRFRDLPSLAELPVALAPGEALEDAFARARQAYAEAGLESFDPRRAYATSPARDFAWYFTINDAGDPWGRTQHVYFVATAPWDEASTRAFLLSYLVMAAAPPNETGRLWFHVYSAEPVPYAVRFLFSNSAEGALEAALLTELGTGRWEPAAMPEIAERSAALALGLGLVPDAGSLAGPCPPGLDLVYLRVARPTPNEPATVFGADYVPEGTLAAVGAMLGESLRRALAPELRWEADDDPVYPRLHADAPQPAILRPIPMMIEFYSSDAAVLPTQYCNQMLAHLSGTPAGD